MGLKRIVIESFANALERLKINHACSHDNECIPHTHNTSNDAYHPIINNQRVSDNLSKQKECHQGKTFATFEWIL